MSHSTSSSFVVFFFNDPPTPEIYTLSLHDALPILEGLPIHVFGLHHQRQRGGGSGVRPEQQAYRPPDRATGLADTVPVRSEETRLNSSHPSISYAVFCLKKKKHQPVHSLPLNLLDD